MTSGNTNSGRPAAVRAVKLVKRYGSAETATTALRGVTLDLVAGEFTAIMGPSGSGKSTLMHCLAGLDTPDQGEVFIGQRRLSQLGDRELTELRRTTVGFIFQQFNLIPTLNALENMVLPLTINGEKPDQQWLGEVIAAVGLGDRLHHRPTQLSGGQQQRVACAHALLSKPDVVFADEPTGNLDSRSGAEVLRLLRSAVDQFGQTVAMVTHDPSAATHADRVVFLADGEIAGQLREPSPTAILDLMRQLDRTQQLSGRIGA
jgi:putative ABC transport system ATP-binding protein